MEIMPKGSGMIEIDFEVLDENYSRYLVKDGTIVRAKIVVRKIFKSPQTTPQGYPANMGIDGTNIVAAMVPSHLKREPSQEPWNPTKDVGEEVKFEIDDEKWQSYLASDGLKILVKPVVTKIIKYSKYNEFGEPIYSATIQSIINMEKKVSTAKS